VQLTFIHHTIYDDRQCSLGAHNQTESLNALAVERGIWADARQRPGILLRKLTPSAPFPWENITSLIAEPIQLLESNFDAIKKEVLSTVTVRNCQYSCFHTIIISWQLDKEASADSKIYEFKNDKENVTDGGSWQKVEQNWCIAETLLS
jgi:hypothetical protein